MTIDELYKNLDGKLSTMDTKLDVLNDKVVRHEENLTTNNREVKDLKDRIRKLESWMWINIGAGGMAGAGIAKIILN